MELSLTRWLTLAALTTAAATVGQVGCGAEDGTSTGTSAPGGGGSSSTGTGGGAGQGGTGGLGGTGGAGGQGGDPTPPDPCLAAQPATCPVPPTGLTEGSGLVAIDRCAFPIEEQGFDPSPNSAIAQLTQALPVRSLAEVLADLNRTATIVTTVPGNPANVTQAFGWNNGDQQVAYWIPQGLTGSADASTDGLVAGREVVLASWYYDIDSHPSSNGEKGVRVSLADVTTPSAISYRHLLLVEPTVVGGQVDFLPVNIHAGGMAWVDDYLYVADTTHGFRVFDLSQIMQVATADNTIGWDPVDGVYYAGLYKYVVPQVGNYERGGDCSPRFSFVALDRTTDPHALVSGEYDSGSLFGRLFRWPLAPSSARLAPATSFPELAYFSLHSHLQGAVAAGPTHWLSSSEPPQGHGDLYVAAEGTVSQTVTWVDAPEDLQLDQPRNKLWSLSEGHGERYVFAVAPPP